MFASLGECKLEFGDISLSDFNFEALEKYQETKHPFRGFYLINGTM